MRLPERFLEAAGSFTSSYFSTPIAASLALRATLAMLAHYFQIQEGNSSKRRLPIPARRLPATLRCSGPFPHCRASGLYQASSMTWRPDWLRSSCRRRRFVLCQLHWITVRVATFRALHVRVAHFDLEKADQVSSPDGSALTPGQYRKSFGCGAQESRDLTNRTSSRRLAP